MMLKSRAFAGPRPCQAGLVVPSGSRRVVCAAQQGAQQHTGQVVAAIAASILLSCAPSLAAIEETSQPGSNLGFMSDQEVLERRQEFGFKRAFDGKVALMNRTTKSLWDVKLDLKSPGTLLLRSPEGLVHYLAYESLTQIDLSDDEVCGAIAASAWESNVRAVEAMDEKEEVHKFELTREGFYGLLSVVNP